MQPSFSPYIFLSPPMHISIIPLGFFLTQSSSQDSGSSLIQEQQAKLVYF